MEKQKKSKKAVIVVGGDPPQPDLAQKALQDMSRLTIAADSGFDFLHQHGYAADYLIGDMDSTAGEQNAMRYLSADRVIKYPRDKDKSDTELALQLAADLGCRDITLIGGGGGRLDHLLAVYSLFYRSNPPDRWFSSNGSLYTLQTGATLFNLKGATVSLLPLAADSRANSAGLRWPLDSLCWSFGDLGLSNQVVDEVAKIEMVSGRLALIVTGSWQLNAIVE